MRWCWIAIFSLVLSALNGVAAPPDSVVEAWFKMNFASIRANQPGGSGWITYTFEITPASDTRIQITGVESGKKTEGTLMLVSGVLLSKDLPLEPGYEIDAIDGPALTLQLVNKLLAFGAGKAPSELTGNRAVDLTEKTTPIHVNTTSAEGTYPVPWGLVGSINSVSPNSVSFDLTHSIRTGAGHEEKIRYVGRWENRPIPPELPDSLPLVGWKTFFLGPMKRSDSRGTIIDYSSRASEESYATVGALREAVKKSKEE
jgi:hypothetical protein